MPRLCSYPLYPQDSSHLAKQVTMETSHEQLPLDCTPQLGTPPRKNRLNPNSTMLRSWVNEKLSIIPSTYNKYDEGIRAIKDQMHQAFLPQCHSQVMQLFHQEFYAIGTGSGETADELWARWRTIHRKKVDVQRRTSSIYSTDNMEFSAINPHYPESPASQEGRAELDISVGVQSVNATRKRQIRTSLLISETEAKLLQNRGSNYWGDLAIPVLPQTTGKAKIVYISPKSARSTVTIENQQPDIDPSVATRTFDRRESARSPRRNSLPIRTSPHNCSIARGFPKGAPASEIHLNFPNLTENMKDITGIKHPSTAGEPSVPLNQPVPHLNVMQSYDNNSFFPYRSTPPTSASRESFGNHNNGPGRTFPGDITSTTFGPGTLVHSGSSLYETATTASSLSEKLYPSAPITRDTYGETNQYWKSASIEALSLQYSGSIRPSTRKNPGLTIRTDGNLRGNFLGGVHLQEVHKGHGMLGLPRPVVSMVASPNMVSPVVEGGGSYLHKPHTAREHTEPLISTPSSSSQEYSPLSFYELPDSIHSSSSRSSNGLKVNLNLETFNPFHRPPVKDYSNNSEHHVSMKSGVLLTKDPLLRQKSFLRDQHSHSQLNSNSVPATRSAMMTSSEEINQATSQKLRSRFSFVLPNVHLGPRITAHSTRRRNSLRSPGLKVTKEVLREEEEQIIGNPSQATFTAHVPRFGKDPMKEIHKAHAKYETKKPAFLRAIQDGIDFARKSSPKSSEPVVNTWRAAQKQSVKVDKLTISEPMHDGNPLKLSNSSSTPNVLKNATPIHGLAHNGSISLRSSPKPSIVLQTLPVIAPPDHQGVNRQQTALKPWELDETPMGAEEFLSSEDEDEKNMEAQVDQVEKAIPKVGDQPTITIDPFSQGALYSWLECSVVQACSDFLRQQQEHLNLDLLKKEIKKWNNFQVKLSSGKAKPRDLPFEFMFGMEAQCKLLEGNHKTLHFSGPSAMNALPVIIAWKNVIPSFSPRTFCFPDYLILEHLRVAEKVLRLFGPAYWDSVVFETKRVEIVRRIIEAGQGRKNRSKTEKIAKLQRDRERAEASLLQAVGIWSAEGVPATVISEEAGDEEEHQ